jgi:universal stress protein E
MKKPTYILSVLDQGPMDDSLLTKAARMAARFDARLELFLCDAEHAYMLKREYEPSHNEEFRRRCMGHAVEYLVGMRDSAGLSGPRVSISAACESPLYEGIVRKVLRSRPDLVVKNASGLRSRGRAAFDPNDWQLMRKCPATLMMTRGRAWRIRPLMAVAVDISAGETEGLAGSIIETAEGLRSTYAGELDILYAERGGTENEVRKTHEIALRKLAQACNLREESVRVLDGDPEQVLPAFAAERDYDVLVMGALTHHPGTTALVGTLTSKLVDTIDCDFVLVKPHLEE